MKPHVRCTFTRNFIHDSHILDICVFPHQRWWQDCSRGSAVRVKLFTRPFLPSPLSPRPHRKGLGTKPTNEDKCVHHTYSTTEKKSTPCAIPGPSPNPTLNHLANKPQQKTRTLFGLSARRITLHIWRNATWPAMKSLLLESGAVLIKYRDRPKLSRNEDLSFSYRLSVNGTLT